METNEVKKELYKTKVNAVLKRVVKGQMIYEVEVSGGIYQFPVDVVDRINTNLYKLEIKKQENNEDDLVYTKLEGKYYALAADLGDTPFEPIIKASELNRWIAKAIEKGEFIKIN